MSFSSATCPQCQKRYGWSGEDRPPCPGCGYIVEPDAEIEAKLNEIRKQLLDDLESDG